MHGFAAELPGLAVGMLLLWGLASMWGDAFKAWFASLPL